MVCTLGTGKRRGFDSQAGRGGRADLYLNALMAQELDARTPVEPTAPVVPEQGSRTDDKWMQEYTHLTRLACFAAIPLTPLPQGAGAAMAEAGCIDHAQAAISFSAMFLDTKRLPGWTAQRPIWLEQKVGSGEAASFPGGRGGRRSIPRGWCRGSR
jgi:hypothetical protein